MNELITFYLNTQLPQNGIAWVSRDLLHTLAYTM